MYTQKHQLLNSDIEKKYNPKRREPSKAVNGMNTGISESSVRTYKKIIKENPCLSSIHGAVVVFRYR